VKRKRAEDKRRKTNKNMRDFTLTIYKRLLEGMLESGYKYITFADFIQGPDKKEKTIILRHDVDKKPLQSIKTAEMENKLGIKGTYYFRVVNNEFAKEVIKQISALGHEIGYHYEDMNAAGGDIDKALDSFQKNLAQLRELAPVKTACMHGSPFSRHDNREMWKNHSYRELGIIGEPYFDVDFSKVMYLTDTGRRWDGRRVSIRDKVRSEGLEVRGERSEVRGDRAEARGDGLGVRGEEKEKIEDRGQKEKECRGVVCDPPVLDLHSTEDIINALKENRLPDQIMLTIHPQRWTDKWGAWLWELVSQKVKNGVKYFIVRYRGNKVRGQR
jgi:hypothetical protein